jgi:pantoate--beta-alanine ligase
MCPEPQRVLVKVALAIVRRLVRDLNIQLKVVGVPTVRERDRLATSSRNRRLTLRQRAFAPCLYKALQAARKSIAYGERNPAAVKARVAEILHSVPDITLEYFDLVDPDTIRPVEVIQAPVRAALAAWSGKTRLIDNVLCEPPALPIEHSKNHSESLQAPTKLVDHVSLRM